LTTDVLIFAPYTGGHHAEYLRHLVEGSRVYARNVSLRVALAPALLQHDADLEDLAVTAGDSPIEFVLVPDADLLGEEGVGLWRRGLWHRRVLRALSARFRPRHLFLSYLDHAQLALASRVRLDGSPDLSGILFRPTLHYAGHVSGVRAMRKRLLLRAALGHPHLKTVFSLDPTAVDAISQYASGTAVVALPDPVPDQSPTRAPDEVRRELGVHPERRCALLFGALTERKGVAELLEAAAALPSHQAGQVAIVLAGVVDDALRERLRAGIPDAQGAGVQIILLDRFADDVELANIIHAADVVLLPYQKHVGSSGVLGRAAAAGKPVIAQSYGLLGHLVRRHGLGVTCDTSDATALSAALGSFAERNVPFDRAAAAKWADANTVESFQKTIWESILLSL
jgi:glycosyltransferase involved in cell wall biosynthesis